MQGQDANGDQCRGRDFRHQNAQRLEFSDHFGRATLAIAPKVPPRCLQELAQSLIVSRVKRIVALLTIAGSLTIAACSFFEPGESVQEESGRARYRAAEENPLNAPDVTSLREKVPGETR